MDINRLDDLVARTLTCCQGLVKHDARVDLKTHFGPELLDRMTLSPESRAAQWRKELADLVGSAALRGLDAVHPSWFVPPLPDLDQGLSAHFTPVAEQVLEHLPEAVRDRVAILAGAAGRMPGRLSPQQATEVARRVWQHLVPMPEKPTGDPLTDLPLKSQAFLESTIRKLGARIMGLLLSAVPERAAAAFCRNLPPADASEVWLHRKTPASDRPLLGSLKKNARKILSSEPTGMIWTLGARIFSSTLAETGPVVRQVAQRLPRSLGETLVVTLNDDADPSSPDSPALEPAVRAEALGWLQEMLD